MSTNVSFAARRLMVCAAVVLMTMLAVTPAKAVFHLWAINEVYSNSSGSLQFIELIDTFGGQNSVAGQDMRTFDIGALHTNVVTLTSNLSGNTNGHSFLFGTAGLAAAGGPTPDFIIPNGFVFQAGGSINFFGINSGDYTALPVDGIHSRVWLGGADAVNSPRNFAGQTGSVPAPTSLAAAAAAGCLALRRRRTVTTA